MAYARRPEDPDWSGKVAVTFPIHGSMFRHQTKTVPVSRTDCPAIRKHITCGRCRKCY